MKTRRMFEPTGKFDRVLYAIMAITLPHTIFAIWNNPELEFAALTCVIWWAIATSHTISWILSSYRRWKVSSPGIVVEQDKDGKDAS